MFRTELESEAGERWLCNVSDPLTGFYSVFPILLSHCFCLCHLSFYLCPNFIKIIRIGFLFFRGFSLTFLFNCSHVKFSLFLHYYLSCWSTSFFMRSFVAVENFPQYSLGVYPPTSSADSKTTLVKLSLKLSIFPFILSISCEYLLFWILITYWFNLSLTVQIFGFFILNNFSFSL